MTSWLVRGRPRQFMVIHENSRCSIVPFGRAGREVARGDLQAGSEGERGQLMFPGAGAGAVGAARVGGDQQAPGLRVGGAARVFPPAADRLHSEPGSVMVRADVHPARVRGQVVNAVRDGLAQFLIGEVVVLDVDGLARGPPFTAAVVVVTDQFLLLGVHADHRLPGVAEFPDLLVEIAELRIPVRDLVSLDGLGVALQAEALLPQQVSHRVSAGAVALPGELGRQRPQRLRRPPQRRHRITALIRLHQRQQRRPQARVQVSKPLAAPARLACPSQRLRAAVQLVDPQRHRGFPDPCRASHHPDPAMTQDPGLSPISSRRCRSSRCGKITPNFAASISPVSNAMPIRHTTSPGADQGTYGLFIDRP
jgi:hypothetical protein